MVAQLSCNGGSTLLGVRKVATFYHFFYTLHVDRLLQLVQLSHHIKQVNPPKFYLQHLVWGSYLSSLQNGTKCKTWLNSPGLPFFRIQISKWRSFKKRAIFDLLFTFFSQQGKDKKILQHISHSYAYTYFAHPIPFLPSRFCKNCELIKYGSRHLKRSINNKMVSKNYWYLLTLMENLYSFVNPGLWMTVGEDSMQYRKRKNLRSRHFVFIGR